MPTMTCYRDPASPIEERVEDLLRQMTIEEKIGQTQQLSTKEDVQAEIGALASEGMLGSLVLAGTALAGNNSNNNIRHDLLNNIQRLAVEHSRLGIPLIFGRDVIHGHRTVFPIPLAQAASFDPQVVENACRWAAYEASADGVHWTFAPMVDISRDSRWGRTAESYGEDPYLSGVMGVAAVGGFQGENPAADGCILACAKHFVGYGAAEGGRDYNTAEISDNTLRNIYLPPFKDCCDAGVATIMSGFCDINGEAVSGSHYLLTQILRHEWGWDGFVVSDWASVGQLAEHGMAEDAADAARIGFNAGVDMDMSADVYRKHLRKLIESGRVSEDRLNEAVRRILSAKFRKGLFEHPYIDIEKSHAAMRSPVALADAERAAARGFVLLKNKDNALPLSKESRVGIGGPMLDDRRTLLGCWTLDGDPQETTNFREAWDEIAPEMVVARFNPALVDQSLLQICNTRADTIVLFLGEDQAMTGEDNAVVSLDLAPGQVELARAAKQWGKKVVAIVQCGRALVLTNLEPWCDAILVCWHAGSQTAPAVVKTLLGEYRPSGRLPVTFPRHTGQLPLHYNYKPTGRHYGKGGVRDTDFRSSLERYNDCPGQPLYPFGFGLGYGQIQMENVRIESSPKTVAALEAGEPVVLAVDLINTGDRADETVPQVYVRDCVSETTRPVRELKAFRRIAVDAGQRRTERFELNARAFGYYGRNGSWRVDPGRFLLSVAAHSGTPFQLEITLEQDGVSVS